DGHIIVREGIVYLTELPLNVSSNAVVGVILRLKADPLSSDTVFLLEELILALDTLRSNSKACIDRTDNGNVLLPLD
ncbi:MAG: hypothetical protein IJM44_02850, partial [Ruminococcus sp.]|nr:hypothetical protein [Ruminococcus sp.]